MKSTEINEYSSAFLVIPYHLLKATQFKHELVRGKLLAKETQFFSHGLIDTSNFFAQLIIHYSISYGGNSIFSRIKL